MKHATLLSDQEVNEIRSLVKTSIASLASLPESYQRDLTIGKLDLIERILTTETKA